MSFPLELPLIGVRNSRRASSRRGLRHTGERQQEEQTVDTRLGHALIHGRFCLHVWFAEACRPWLALLWLLAMVWDVACVFVQSVIALGKLCKDAYDMSQDAYQSFHDNIAPIVDVIKSAVHTDDIDAYITLKDEYGAVKEAVQSAKDLKQRLTIVNRAECAEIAERVAQIEGTLKALREQYKSKADNGAAAAAATLAPNCAASSVPAPSAAPSAAASSAPCAASSATPSSAPPASPSASPSAAVSASSSPPTAASAAASSGPSSLPAELQSQYDSLVAALKAVSTLICAQVMPAKKNGRTIARAQWIIKQARKRDEVREEQRRAASAAANADRCCARQCCSSAVEIPLPRAEVGRSRS